MKTVSNCKSREVKLSRKIMTMKEYIDPLKVSKISRRIRVDA